MEKHKFNVTDLILILIILAAAAVLIYIVAGTNLFLGGEEIDIQYTIEMPLVRNEYLPAINKIMPGDKITESVRSYDIGEIQKVSISEGLAETTNLEKGIVQRVPYPDHSRLLITVKAKAQKDSKDLNYLINGKIIMVGVQIHFRTQHFTNTGTCIAMEVIKEG